MTDSEHSDDEKAGKTAGPHYGETGWAAPHGATAPVTVVIPCRNMARQLGHAIRSALDQVPSPREVVVIDDRSTDDSKDVAKGFGDRVIVLDGPGEGSAVARNIGLLASTQPFVAFLDADDYWLPGKLAAQLERLTEPRFDACFTDWYQTADDEVELGRPVFEADYSMVSEGDIFTALLKGNFILTSSIMIRRSAFARAGLFDRRLRGSQDYELWLRLARTMQFAWERRALAVKVDHSANITASHGYAALRAKAYQAIYDTHWGDANTEERKLLQRNLAEQLECAGRHALRHKDFAAARRHLASACSQAENNRGYRLWYCISLLPAALLTRLIDWRHRQKAA